MVLLKHLALRRRHHKGTLATIASVTLLACVTEDVSPAGKAVFQDAGTVSEASPTMGPEGGPDAQADAEIDLGPPPLATPDLWLDARIRSSVDGTFWRDLSPQKNDVSATTALTRVDGSSPGTGIFNRAAIDLGGNTSLRLARGKVGMRIGQGKGFCLFAVAASNGTPLDGQQLLFRRKDAPDAVGPSGIEVVFEPTRVVATANIGDYTVVQQSKLAQQPHVYVVCGRDESFGFGVDERPMGWAVLSTVSPRSLGETSALDIGSAGDNVRDKYFDGYLGAFLVYDRRLTDSEITTAVTKLRQDWGIR
jgi:hypothetical protein